MGWINRGLGDTGDVVQPHAQASNEKGTGEARKSTPPHTPSDRMRLLFRLHTRTSHFRFLLDWPATVATVRPHNVVV